jgi:hypothetical protein
MYRGQENVDLHIHWIGGCVGPRAGLDEVEKTKFLTPPGLKLRPLGRPALSRYTDCAIPAPLCMYIQGESFPFALYN